MIEKALGGVSLLSTMRNDYRVVVQSPFTVEEVRGVPEIVIDFSAGI